MSGMRWSESELLAHQLKTGAKISSSFGAGMNLTGTSAPDNLTVHSQRVQPLPADGKALDKGKNTPRKASVAILRAKEVARSVRTAIVTGHYEPGKCLELIFDGAKMLSINDLYKLTHYQRIDYRNAWHEAIHLAVLQVLGAKAGQIASIEPMDRFRVSAIRHSTALCDIDALHGYFKYPIDGLRYAKIITDDSPRHLIGLTASQKSGPYLMGIRVESVTGDVGITWNAHAQEGAAFIPFNFS